MKNFELKITDENTGTVETEKAYVIPDGVDIASFMEVLLNAMKAENEKNK